MTTAACRVSRHACQLLPCRAQTWVERAHEIFPDSVVAAVPRGSDHDSGGDNADDGDDSEEVTCPYRWSCVVCVGGSVADRTVGGW
jgi:hypothetical protein